MASINLAEEFEAPAKVNLAAEFHAPEKVDLSKEFAPPAIAPVASQRSWLDKNFMSEDEYRRRQATGEVPPDSGLGTEVNRLVGGVIQGVPGDVADALASKPFQQTVIPMVERNALPMAAAALSGGVSLIPQLAFVAGSAALGDAGAQTQEIGQGMRQGYSPREMLAAGLTGPLFVAAPLAPNNVVAGVVQGAAEGAMFTGISGTVGGRDVSTDELLGSALMGAAFRGVQAAGGRAALQEQLLTRARELGYAGTGKMDDLRTWYRAATARPVSAAGAEPRAARPLELEVVSSEQRVAGGGGAKPPAPIPQQAVVPVRVPGLPGTAPVEPTPFDLVPTPGATQSPVATVPAAAEPARLDNVLPAVTPPVAAGEPLPEVTGSEPRVVSSPIAEVTPSPPVDLSAEFTPPLPGGDQGPVVRGSDEVPVVAAPALNPEDGGRMTVGAAAATQPFTLPRELAGAKPGYAYGAKQFTLTFDSELDKALYVLAQGKPSKRDADYLALVQAHTGMTEPEARAAGRVVRDDIKAQAKAAKAGELTIPAVHRAIELQRTPVTAPPAVSDLPVSAVPAAPVVRTFPQVAQFNAKGLPDRVKGDPRGRDDKFGIVLVDQDGVAHGRKVFKSAGKVMVQDAGDLLARPQSKTTNRTLADLQATGFTVLHEPFQFTSAAPDFKVSAAPADFDRWMGESVQKKQEVRAAIEQGVQQDVILKTIAEADPDTAVGLMAVQETVANLSGGGFAHTTLGLTKRIDTAATGERAGAKATKTLAAAQADPTSLLWKKNGKLFGILTSEEWQGVKELAAMGDNAGVAQLIESKFALPEASAAQTRQAVTAWATGVAEEGKRKQAGDAAYRGKGSGVAKPVDISADTNAGGNADAPDLSDTLADPSGDRTADIPLTSGKGETVEATRAALKQTGLTDDEVDFVSSEIVDATHDEVSEIMQLAYGDELRGFVEKVRKAENPRALIAEAIQNFLDHHEILSTQGSAAEGSSGANTALDQTGGARRSAESIQALGGETQGLTHEHFAEHLPSASGAPDTVSVAGRITREPRLVDRADGVRFNVEAARLAAESELAALGRIIGAAVPAPGAFPGQPISEGFRRGFAAQESISRDLAKSLGLDFVGQGEAYSGSVARPAFMGLVPESNGRLTLVMSERAVEAIWLRAGGDLETAERLTKAAFEEEAIHAAQFISLRKDWVSGGKHGDFITHMLNRTANLLSQLAYQAKQDKGVEAVINDAWTLYFGGIPKTRPEMLKLLSGPDVHASLAQANHFAFELARMVSQKQRGGEITERARLPLFRVLNSWFDGALRNIRNLSLSPERMGTGYADLLKRTNAILDGKESVPVFSPDVQDAKGIAEAIEAMGVNTQPLETYAVRINQTLAALNVRLAAEARIAPVLAKLGKDLAWFRDEFGLTDPAVDKLQAAVQTGPGGASLTTINPHQTLADFSDKATRVRAATLAHATLQKQIVTLGEAAISDQAELLKAERALVKLRQRETDLHTHYLSAEGLAPIIRRGVARFVIRQLRASATNGRQQGELMQLVRQLDAQALPKDYAGAFKKLARNKDLTGRNLFDLLDTLVNQANIDFKARTIVEIRQAIAERVAAHPEKTELGLLVQNTPESRALLAGLTAYAKTNEQMLIKIEQRRLKSVEERTRLQDELAQIMASKGAVAEALRGVEKSAKLEERARVAYNQTHEQTLRLSRRVDARTARLDAVNAVLPELSRELQGLANELGGVVPHIPFADGLIVNIPPTPAATGKEIDAAPMQIRLSGEVTPKADIDRARLKLREWIAAREAEAKHNPDLLDAHYWQAKAHLGALVKATWTDTANRKVDVMSRMLWAQSVARKGEALGVAAGRSISQLVHGYGARAKELDRKFETPSLKVEHALREAMDVLAPMRLAGRKLSADQFKALFEQPAKAAMHDEKALLELMPADAAKRRVMQQLMNRWLENPLTEKFVRGTPEHQAEVAASILRFLEADEKAYRLRVDVNEANNLSVRDDSLKVQLPDGSWADGLREALPDGVMTFSRRQADGVAAWVNHMRGTLGWGEWNSTVQGNANADSIAEMYAQGGAADVRAALARFIDNTVTQKFLRAIATDPNRSALDAPGRGGFVPEADPATMIEAWTQAKGDLVTFLEAAFTLHGGTDGKGAYIQAQLARIGELYAEKALANPEADGAFTGGGGLFEDLMIDSRRTERRPGEWFEYGRHDRQQAHQLNMRQAAQIEFGREGERINTAVKALDAEVKAQLVPYHTWLAEARAAQAGTRAVDKAVRAQFVAQFGAAKGVAEFHRVRLLDRRQGQVAAIREDLQRIFKHDPYTLSAATGYLASGAIQQFTTAIGQFAELMNPLMAQGVSGRAVADVARAMGYLGEEFVGTFMDFVGQAGLTAPLKTLLPMSAESEAYLREQGIDPRAERRFFDAFAGEAGPITKTLRAIPNVSGLTVSGKTPRYTALSPLAPFTYVNNTMHAVNVKNTWRRVARMVAKTMEFYASPEGQAALADPAFVMTADHLGLTGFAKNEFENLRTSMADGYDLHLAEMARDAVARAADPAKRMELLTDKERGRIAGLVLQTVTLEGTAANMPAAAFSNSFAKVTLPLLGWGIRRAQQVARVPLTAEGERSWRAFWMGLSAVAAVAVGGLGVNLLLETFDEEALRKKRNARSVTRIPDLLAKGELGELGMTLNESMGRTGALGMWSDALNTGLSLGQTDVRRFSLDQRILLASSVLGTMNAAGKLVAQDGKADYAGVLRPLMQSTGGNSVLQYLQLANTAGVTAGLGPIFGAEEAATRRINATNWLREAGKIADVPTRTYGGPMSGTTATPLTPAITRMVMAAYVNDRAGFVGAWREAVKEARTLPAGKADPAAYVRDQFANRNPLKVVFGSVSEADYGLLLTKLPPSGRVDVQEALRYFNSYAVSLGGREYYGTKR